MTDNWFGDSYYITLWEEKKSCIWYGFISYDVVNTQTLYLLRAPFLRKLVFHNPINCIGNGSVYYDFCVSCFIHTRFFCKLLRPQFPRNICPSRYHRNERRGDAAAQASSICCSSRSIIHSFLNSTVHFVLHSSHLPLISSSAPCCTTSSSSSSFLVPNTCCFDFSIVLC